MQGHPISPEQRQHFLAELAVDANVARSARAASIGTGSLYRLRKSDPDFAAAWAEAIDTALAVLEALAMERATTGSMEFVYDSAGRVVSARRRPSDAILALLLRSKHPEFMDRSKVQVEAMVTGTVHHEVSKINVKRLSNEQLDRMVRLLDEIEGAQAQLPAPEPEDPALEADFEIQGEE